MAPRIIDRTKTVIYKIVCKDLSVPDLYVGSTSNMTRRRASHKNNSKKPEKGGLKIYAAINTNGGWENWQMVAVEAYPDCESGEQARTRERYWYEQLAAAALATARPMVSAAQAVASYADDEAFLECRAQYYAKTIYPTSAHDALYCANNAAQIDAIQFEHREKVNAKARVKYLERQFAAFLRANP
jgi:hypothetical protein